MGQCANEAHGYISAQYIDTIFLYLNKIHSFYGSTISLTKKKNNSFQPQIAYQRTTRCVICSFLSCLMLLFFLLIIVHLQYMCHGCRFKCSLPFTANTHNGTVGSHCIHKSFAQIIGNESTDLSIQWNVVSTTRNIYECLLFMKFIISILYNTYVA